MSAAMTFEFNFADPELRARAAAQPVASSIDDLSQYTIDDLLFPVPSVPASASAWKGRFDPFEAKSNAFPPGPPGIDDFSAATELIQSRKPSSPSRRASQTPSSIPPQFKRITPECREAVNDYCKHNARQLRSRAFADRESRGLMPNAAFAEDLSLSVEAMNTILALRTSRHFDSIVSGDMAPRASTSASESTETPQMSTDDSEDSEITSTTDTLRAGCSNSNYSLCNRGPGRRPEVKVTQPTMTYDRNMYNLIDMGASLDPCHECPGTCHCYFGRSFLSSGEVQLFNIVF